MNFVGCRRKAGSFSSTTTCVKIDTTCRPQQSMKYLVTGSGTRSSFKGRGWPPAHAALSWRQEDYGEIGRRMVRSMVRKTGKNRLCKPPEGSWWIQAQPLAPCLRAERTTFASACIQCMLMHIVAREQWHDASPSPLEALLDSGCTCLSGSSAASSRSSRYPICPSHSAPSTSSGVSGACK